MMKKVQSKVLLSLLLLLCVVSLFAACNGGKNKPSGVELIDFPATKTEEVSLGDFYEITLNSVKDKDGNSYRVSAAVADSKGNAVTPFSGTFDLTDLGGYTITYTVKITDGDVRTMVVTLIVKDTESPIIVLGAVSGEGHVGEKFILPSVTVSDLDEVATLTVTVVNLDDPDTEITVSNENGTYSFVPVAVGVHEMTVTAADTSGNTSVRTAQILVVQTAASYELFNPDYVGATNNVVFALGGDYIEAAYHGGNAQDLSYKDGYVSVTSKKGAIEASGKEFQWARIGFEPYYDLSSYAQYDKIAVWMYVKNESSAATGSYSFFNNNAFRTTITFNEWQLYYFDIDDFLNTYNTSVGLINMTFGNYTAAIAVSEVRLGKIYGITEAGYGATVNVGAVQGTAEVTITVTSTLSSVPSFTLTVLDDEEQPVAPENVSGNVYTYDLEVGVYTYTIESSDPLYYGSYSNEIVVEGSLVIDLDGGTATGVAGSPLDLPDVTVIENNVTTNKQVSVAATYTYAADKTQIEIDDMEELKDFVPTASGTLEITYSYEGAADKHFSVVVERKTSTDNTHLLDLSSRDALFDMTLPDKEYYAGGEDLPSGIADPGMPFIGYTDKTDAGTWRGFDISKAYMDNIVDALDDHKYVRIKLYFKATSDLVVFPIFNVRNQTFANDISTVIVVPSNTWTDVVISIDDIKARINGSLRLFSVTYNGNSNLSHVGLVSAYVADFEFIDEEKAVVTNLPEKFYVGEEITLSEGTVDGSPAARFALFYTNKTTGAKPTDVGAFDGVDKTLISGNTYTANQEGVIALIYTASNAPYVIYHIPVVINNRDDILFDPSKEGEADSLTINKTNPVTVNYYPAAERGDAYSGAYVEVTGNTGESNGPKFKGSKLDAYNAAMENYDFIYFWVKIGEESNKSSQTCTLAQFFGKYNRGVTVGDWHKIYFSIDEIGAVTTATWENILKGTSTFMGFSTASASAMGGAWANLTKYSIGEIGFEKKADGTTTVTSEGKNVTFTTDITADSYTVTVKNAAGEQVVTWTGTDKSHTLTVDSEAGEYTVEVTYKFNVGFDFVQKTATTQLGGAHMSPVTKTYTVTIS